MNFPYSRNRRLRSTPTIRSLVAETSLTVNDFLVPLFVMEGVKQSKEIASMPGYFKYTLDKLLIEIETLQKLGLCSYLVFAEVPAEKKDNIGNEACNADGLLPRSIAAIKKNFPESVVMSDVAFDPYSAYGHDGIVEGQEIVNEKSLEVLSKMALVHAEAGVDFVAPSDMMDGRILRIREHLDKNDASKVGIMAYSAKYASALYGPFRDALDSAPGFGDKKTYQMQTGNRREALNEIRKDYTEGADIVMVKPALHYLDIIQSASQLVDIPIAAYHVSGEYAMVKAAAARGWVDEQAAALEATLAIKRAGADIIASYFAKALVESKIIY